MNEQKCIVCKCKLNSNRTILELAYDSCCYCLPKAIELKLSEIEV